MKNKNTKYCTLLLLLIINIQAFAQKPVYIPSGKDRYKQVAGRYGANDGICLFDDGHFLLYGYATMVFGDYVFENDSLLFYPDTLERFSIFAATNKNIGDSTRICFNGFEEGNTFVQFDKENTQRVFNENANCFDRPYIKTFDKKFDNISFCEKVYEEWQYKPGQPNAFKFYIDKVFNDFIFVYNEPRRERQHFGGMIEIIKNKKVLKLSNYGGDAGYIGAQHKEEDKNWKEILAFKKQYYAAQMWQEIIFANLSYNTFDIHETGNYRYDAALDLYVDIYNTGNDEYYQEDAYNDSRSLRKYVRLKPESKSSIAFGETSISHKPIFFTQCAGDENTVGTLEVEDETEVEIPFMTNNSSEVMVTEILPIDTAKIMERPDYATFQPFSVNLQDGFYEVKHANYADYGNTILAQKPALSKVDIEDVTMDFDESGKPIAKIKFKASAHKKLEIFTRKNIDNPIALVVNKKVISMPIILSVIKGGKVSISGSYTEVEITGIIEHLNNK